MSSVLSSGGDTPCGEGPEPLGSIKSANVSPHGGTRDVTGGGIQKAQKGFSGLLLIIEIL